MTTQLERQETLLLLASLQVGQRVMEPEPRHLEAILELLEEDAMMYPQEHYVVPAEEQARIDRERMERHSRLFPMAKQGPEERAYNEERMPFLFSVLALTVFIAVIAGFLWFLGQVEGTQAVIGAIICIAGLSSAWAFAFIAGCDEPKR